MFADFPALTCTDGALLTRGNNPQLLHSLVIFMDIWNENEFFFEIIIIQVCIMDVYKEGERECSNVCFLFFLFLTHHF